MEARSGADDVKTYLVAYGVTAVVFLAVDAIWLTTMTGALYRPILGDQLVDQPRLVPAIAFYLIYVFGIVFFAILPALQSGQWTTALVHGALFGFIAYATYDLTNQATLKSWSTLLTLADLAWGTILTAIAATFGYLVTTWLVRP